MKSLLCLLLLITPFLARASIWEGKVESIEITLTSPIVLFRLSGELDESPRCNESGLYALDTTLASGPAALEILRAAYANEKPVSAVGLNACSVHFKAEGVKTITFQ